jgi:very-short-patch-repair endonuclease
MAVTKFGHLRQTTPKDTMPGSHEKNESTCDCGRIVDKFIFNVMSNYTTKSCGDCGLIVKQWYQENQKELKKLKAPVKSGYILNGPILALARITKLHDPFLAVCPACKKEYRPILTDIKQGKSLTCMCISSRVSWPVIQIAEFIKSLGFDVEFEYKVENMDFDIFVKNSNTLIEYDGSRWHKTENKKAKDVSKCLKATNLGFYCIRIQEIEWKKNRDNVKGEITERLKNRLVLPTHSGVNAAGHEVATVSDNARSESC